MSFFSFGNKSITRLRSYKKDIAPIGFYFDIFATELFPVPILPIPLRIDKLTNGQPTLFIHPDTKKLDKILEKSGLAVSYQNFFAKGIENFLSYAQTKQKEITLRSLDAKKIREWWTKSNEISAHNPDLVTTFTLIMSKFIETYAFIDKSDINPSQDREEYNDTLQKYCDHVIQYLRTKIENNVFFIKIENRMEKEKLYLEKKEKYYPLVLKIPVHDSRTNKSNEMGFVPYLIYDDLLDSFTYNKQLLKSSKDDSINLKVYEHNQIINNKSSIENIEPSWNKGKLNNIDLEEIIHKLHIL